MKVSSFEKRRSGFKLVTEYQKTEKKSIQNRREQVCFAEKQHRRNRNVQETGFLDETEFTSF
jgi:hypothetical protein